MRTILKYDKWIAFFSIPVFVVIYGAFKPISKQNTTYCVLVESPENVQKFILDKSKQGFKLKALNSYSFTSHQGYVESKFIIVMDK